MAGGGALVPLLLLLRTWLGCEVGNDWEDG